LIKANWKENLLVKGILNPAVKKRKIKRKNLKIDDEEVRQVHQAVIQVIVVNLAVNHLAAQIQVLALVSNLKL